MGRSVLRKDTSAALVQDAEKIIRFLVCGREKEGYGLLSDLAAHLEAFLRDTDTAHVGRVNQALQRVLESMQTGDPVWVADHLRYVLLPAVLGLYAAGGSGGAILPSLAFMEGAESPSEAGFPGSLRLLATAKGVPTACIKGSDRWWFVHSAVDPVAEAPLLLEGLDTTKTQFYFCFGVGLGYHLASLARRITKGSRVLVIEPRGETFQIPHVKELATKLVGTGQFSFLPADDPRLEATINSFLGVNFPLLGTVPCFITLPGYRRALPGWAEGLQSRIMELTRNFVFEMGNDIADTLTGFRQILDNLTEVIHNPGANDLRGAYRGKPAIIVSAGPSLTKNVELLREVKGRALILCVDAAFKVLLTRGIIPDAVLSIERGVATYEYFYKSQEFPPEVVLVAPPVVYPAIFREFQGPKVVLFKDNEGVSGWFDSLLNRGRVSMGTSVAHLAFGFARLVEADPIVFIGQDLAYSPEGYTHSAGTVYEGQKRTDSENATVWVEDYHGNLIPSTPIWKNFLTWFEKEIPQTAARCIDATEGGARIRGTEVLTLRETIDTVIGEDRIAPLNVWLERHYHRSAADDAYELVIKGLREEVRSFQELAKAAGEGLHRLRRIEQEVNIAKAPPAKLRKVLEQIGKNDRVVERILHDSLMTMVFQTTLMLAHRQLADLGERLTPENVQGNMHVQKWFLQRVAAVAAHLHGQLKALSTSVEEGADLSGAMGACGQVSG